MKNFIMVLVILPLSSLAQHAKLVKVQNIASGSNYFYDLHYSPKSDQIIFSINQQSGCILDSNLNVLGRIHVEGFQSKGFSDYSYDQKFIMQLNSNYAKGIASLSVMSTIDSSMHFINRPLFSQYIPFGQSNKVLFYSDGKFDIYHLESGKLIAKNVIDISNEWTKSITSMMLYEEDTKLLLNYTVRPPDATSLKVYNMSDFELLKEIPKPAFNIGKTTLSSDSNFYFYFLRESDFIPESIHIRKVSNDSLVNSIDTDLISIQDVVLSPDGSFLLIRDGHMNLYHCSTTTNAITPLLECLENASIGSMVVCPDNTHFIISLSGKKLLKYKIDLDAFIKPIFKLGL